MEKGLLDAGVQGRYLFRVLVPLLAFVASGLSATRSPALSVATCGAASALFLYGEFPTYLLRATAVFTEGLG